MNNVATHEGHSGVTRLSTAALPERHRLAIVREIYGRTMLKHDFDPLEGTPLDFASTIYTLPGLGMAFTTSSPCRFLRKELPPMDDLIFNLTLRGERTIRQRGREATVRAGEGLLASVDEGVITIRPSHFISLRFSRKGLGPLVADLDSCLLKPIGVGALSLLPRYLRAIDEPIGAAP